MIGKFHLPISAGGALPDPATYCPTNGYLDPDDPDSGVIWNPISPADGWVLLAEFQNNSPNSTTFDPQFTSGFGEYAWDLGDGTILMGQKSVSHTYLTTATRTVKLYGKGTCVITDTNFNTDNIIGEIDLSNSTFSAITILQLFANANLTSVVLPDIISGAMSIIYIYSTGIIGTLNLSAITIISNSSIDVSRNSGMTDLVFAPIITGAVGALSIYSTGIVGILDVSMFTTFTSTGFIRLYSNPSMTGVILPSSITGIMSLIYIHSTGYVGVIDISMFTAFIATADIRLYSNPSMTGVILPSSITGIVRTLHLYSNTSLGYVDTTSLNTGVNTLSWDFKNNGWTAAIVNHVLVDIDGISAAGFTSRVINIGGTNADPDTTSGGYNGTAARNSLIAKGFTVTIT